MILRRRLQNYGIFIFLRTSNKMDYVLDFLFYRVYTCIFDSSQAVGTWIYGNRPFHAIRNRRDVDHYCYNFENRRQLRTISKLKR